MNCDALSRQIEAKRDFGEAVCRRILENIAKLGLKAPVNPPDFNAAEFKLITDPFTQSQDLTGCWLDAEKQRIGEIKFHGDGSFYAEYDVLQNHPHRKNCYVDAIHAWGKQDNIKTEAKLLDIS